MKLFTKHSWSIGLLTTIFVDLASFSYGYLQPKVVTVESHPPQRVFGSLSIPEGSPWCDGRPTYWLVGHQSHDETPFCLDLPESFDVQNTTFSDFDYNNATFSRPRSAILDRQDPLNEIDGPANLDRHAGAFMDVNKDGLVDIICLVGANAGKGYGYNELYLTKNEPYGSIEKVLEGHGLQKYPTMRGRFVITLKGADGSDLIFIATRGAPRADDQTNVHRMFRLTDKPNLSPLESYNQTFFFQEVQGNIWKRNTKANCLIKADLNNDGIDDILMCNLRRRTLMFIQNADSSWVSHPTTGVQSKDWRSARVADITGDGFPDIIAVGYGSPSYVRVFEGKKEYPHYDFLQDPIYELKTNYSTPDVEVLDVNNDGIYDLYVIQVDEETVGTYCVPGPSFDPIDWWGIRGYDVPATYTPPNDKAHDILLVGISPDISYTDSMFEKVIMEHSEPGCGFYAEKFGNDHTMILAQGDNQHPGHNLLLQW